MALNGAKVTAYDTDTHSLNPILRTNPTTDAEHTKKCPVYIKDNAFIGTSCIICKGVTIGKNSIVGAGSVVTHGIPENEF